MNCVIEMKRLYEMLKLGTQGSGANGLFDGLHRGAMHTTAGFFGRSVFYNINRQYVANQSRSSILKKGPVV